MAGPQLTATDVVRLGGWNPDFAVVGKVLTDEDVGVALAASNSLAFELEVGEMVEAWRSGNVDSVDPTVVYWSRGGEEGQSISWRAVFAGGLFEVVELECRCRCGRSDRRQRQQKALR